jgi:MprA protease rhombosortase-interaction domain-containing protein
MTEREALAHYHDGRACLAAPQSRDTPALALTLHQVVAVPVSIGLATLLLAAGTLSFCTRRLPVAQNFGTSR